MAKNPFKVGDKVYVYPQGWGITDHLSEDNCKVNFDSGVTDLISVRLVSFTEYDPGSGGLSHERPEEQFKSSGFINGAELAGALNRSGDCMKRLNLDNCNRPTEEPKTDGFEDEQRQDTIPADAAERNLKALKYIKGLLKDDYNVVEDYIGVEGLGSEVNVSLTFRKG